MIIMYITSMLDVLSSKKSEESSLSLASKILSTSTPIKWCVIEHNIQSYPHLASCVYVFLLSENLKTKKTVNGAI